LGVRWCRFRAGLLGILLLAGCEMESPGLPETFEAADALARQHSATPEGAHYENVEVVKQQKLSGFKGLMECYASVGTPDRTPFRMVLAITEGGVVKRVYLDRETNVALCVQDDMLGELFTPPPFAPFYQSFTMSFHASQPQRWDPNAP
jgi:hypothetical protein